MGLCMKGKVHFLILACLATVAFGKFFNRYCYYKPCPKGYYFNRHDCECVEYCSSKPASRCNNLQVFNPFTCDCECFAVYIKSKGVNRDDDDDSRSGKHDHDDDSHSGKHDHNDDTLSGKHNHDDDSRSGKRDHVDNRRNGKHDSDNSGKHNSDKTSHSGKHDRDNSRSGKRHHGDNSHNGKHERDHNGYGRGSKKRGGTGNVILKVAMKCPHFLSPNPRTCVCD